MIDIKIVVIELIKEKTTEIEIDILIRGHIEIDQGHMKEGEKEATNEEEADLTKGEEKEVQEGKTHLVLTHLCTPGKIKRRSILLNKKMF